MGPLDGSRVVELTDSIAGYTAGMLLSDYGATVIRIDRPGVGSGRSKPGLVPWNRGKKSVTLDIEAPRGREALVRLLQRSDVFLETLPQREAARLGIDYPTLHPLLPRLVYCSITGYDMNGPDRDRPGYDGLVQARAGIMPGGSWTRSGPQGGGGHRPGPKYMGFAAPSRSAAFFGCLGILTALYVRGETGQGQHVNASLYAGAMAMSRWSWAENPGPRPDPERFLYGIWQAGDGEWLWTHTSLRGSFDRFMDLFGIPEFKATADSPPWTQEEDQRVRKKVAEIIKTKPMQYWLQTFQEADCPTGPALYPGESFDDAQVNTVEMVVAVEDPELGLLKEVGVPIKMERTPGSVRASAPWAGDHTTEVLLELGYSEGELAFLRRDGVI